MSLFYQIDKYTVDWDSNAGKKGKKGYTRDSRKARLKNENLRLWGTGVPLEKTSQQAVSGSSDKENSKRKSQTKAAKKEAPSSKPAPPGSVPAPAPEESAPTMKCCAICHKEHDLEPTEDGDKKKQSNFEVLPCAHIFCIDCCAGGFLPNEDSTVEVRVCRVCSKYDPGVDSLQVLPYVIDLRDPSEELLHSIYKEYSLILTCENIEKMEKQHQRELDTLESQKVKVIKQKKDEINKKQKDSKGNSKTNKEQSGKLIKAMVAR